VFLILAYWIYIQKENEFHPNPKTNPNPKAKPNPNAKPNQITPFEK
jgi:hypothetical protein